MTRAATILAALIALQSAPAAAQQTATIDEPLSWLNLPESVLEGLKGKPPMPKEEREGFQWLLEMNNPHRSLVPGKHLPAEPNINRQVVPPLEYDKPYQGWLKLERVKTEQDVVKVCPKTAFPIKLGCSYQYGERAKDGSWASCRVVMVADEVIRKAWYTPELVLRHEIGHCNGWPGDHFGARFTP